MGQTYCSERGVSQPLNCLRPDQDSTGRFPRLAPPYKISVALLRSVTSCFGCSTNVNESFPLIAAALDEDLRLEIDAAAFDIVGYVIAVLLGCQPSCCPFAGVDTQRSHVAILLRCRVAISIHSLKNLSACASRARACWIAGNGKGQFPSSPVRAGASPELGIACEAPARGVARSVDEFFRAGQKKPRRSGA